MSTEALKKIHYDLKEMLDRKDFKSVVEYTKGYDQSTDIGVLRTALIILKSWREEEELKEEFHRLCSILEPQVKTL